MQSDLPISTVDKPAMLAHLLARRLSAAPRRLLVVGCGSGLEALALQQEFNCEVVGIDVDTRFDPMAARKVTLLRGDAQSLDFDSGSFDFVYSYHALEHIPDHKLALQEMSRVLMLGGRYCIGTPNRERLLGYLGSSGTRMADKVRWNIDDWRMRLRGKFHNRYGAHAGFTAGELTADLREAFGEGTVPRLLLDAVPEPRNVGQGASLQRGSAVRVPIGLFPRSASAQVEFGCSRRSRFRVAAGREDLHPFICVARRLTKTDRWPLVGSLLQPMTCAGRWQVDVIAPKSRV